MTVTCQPVCSSACLSLSSDGYNMWRDAKKPTTILAELCRENSIPSPEYRATEVKVLNKIFKIPPDAVPEGVGQNILCNTASVSFIRSNTALLLLTPVTVNSSNINVVVVVSSAEEEPAVPRGECRDGGACGPECAAALGGDEGVPPWCAPSGRGARGDPLAAQPGQAWTAAGDRNTANKLYNINRNKSNGNTMPLGSLNVISSVCVCTLQGYLHMWVDMFPNDVPAPPPVDIKPRLPEQ